MSLFEQAIGWISPPQCIGCSAEGSVLCSHCRDANVVQYGERCGYCNILSPNSKTCLNCRRKGLPSHISITTTYDGLIRKLVRDYKFGHQRFVSDELAKLMVDTFVSLAPQITTEHLIVPIPTATKRVRERGFDHAALLAKHIAQKLNLPYANLLGRIGQSSQVGADRSRRQSQTAGEYYVRAPGAVAGRRILVVDDVMTTGATLRAATNMLRTTGAKTVDALVLAKKV